MGFKSPVYHPSFDLFPTFSLNLVFNHVVVNRVGAYRFATFDEYQLNTLFRHIAGVHQHQSICVFVPVRKCIGKLLGDIAIAIQNAAKRLDFESSHERKFWDARFPQRQSTILPQISPQDGA